MPDMIARQGRFSYFTYVHLLPKAALRPENPVAADRHPSNPNSGVPLTPLTPSA